MALLSKRELEVYVLIIEGLTNREIAARLFVCEKTVKFHCTQIYKKQQVQTRARLIVQAYKNANKMAVGA